VLPSSVVNCLFFLAKFISAAMLLLPFSCAL